jgi:hypothetical protein
MPAPEAVPRHLVEPAGAQRIGMVEAAGLTVMRSAALVQVGVDPGIDNGKARIRDTRLRPPELSAGMATCCTGAGSDTRACGSMRKTIRS